MQSLQEIDFILSILSQVSKTYIIPICQSQYVPKAEISFKIIQFNESNFFWKHILIVIAL